MRTEYGIHNFPTNFSAKAPKPVQESALRAFDAADGTTSDLFVPQQEEYEELAADFLTSWLHSSEECTEKKSAVAPPSEASNQEKALSDPPPFSQFSIDLDWQLADEQFK